MTLMTKRTIMTLAAITAVLSVGFSLISAEAIQEKIGETLTLSSPPSGPQKYLDAGKPVMITNTITEKVSLMRGQTQLIPITLDYQSTDASTITIIPSVDGFIIPDSVLKRTTMQERAETLSTGKILEGVIPMSSFVEFIPSTVVLNSGDVTQIHMKVTIPEDLSEEVYGDIGISPSFNLVDKVNADKVAVFSTYVDLRIEG
jgi:hypothetical protein